MEGKGGIHIDHLLGADVFSPHADASFFMRDAV
jgi:hypothetical protein